MAAYAKQVFGDLGRLALKMARLGKKDAARSALDTASEQVEARVRDAELEGSDLDADWRGTYATRGAP
jgi:hypothetical protein